MDDINLMSCLPISNLHFFDLCHESILLCIGQAFQAFDRVVHTGKSAQTAENVSSASLELAGEEQRFVIGQKRVKMRQRMHERALKLLLSQTKLRLT